MPEPENLILTILRELRAEMGAMRGEMAETRSVMATKDDIADVRAEIRSLGADVASDMLTLEKRLGDQISTLRRAVMEYHSSTIGQACFIRTSRSGCAASSSI